MLCDQILNPADFPWDGSESQMVALEVKQRIKSTLESLLNQEMMVINQTLHDQILRRRVEQQEQYLQELQQKKTEFAEMDEDDYDEDDRD